jgi:hypothetical protein
MRSERQYGINVETEGRGAAARAHRGERQRAAGPQRRSCDRGRQAVLRHDARGDALRTGDAGAVRSAQARDDAHLRCARDGATRPGLALERIVARGQEAVPSRLRRLHRGDLRELDTYSGERFDVEPSGQQQGDSTLVYTKIVDSDGVEHAVNYIVGRGGKVFDTYFDGTISDVAARRSEFTGLLQSSGPDQLIQSLTDRTRKLLDR